MPRFHATPHGMVPFTAEEEAEWDAREAAEKLPNALAQFAARRDVVIATGVTHAGHLWHCDPLSQHAYAAAIMLGEKYEAATGQPWSTVWKTLSGNITVTVADLVAAGLVVGAKVQACFAREAELAAQAKGGDVDGALAQIDTGWPS